MRCFGHNKRLDHFVVVDEIGLVVERNCSARSVVNSVILLIDVFTSMMPTMM
ncbi:hypothetical protein E1A91_D01G239900v1 [Gossypium mustelinum]|uniref:Uncharacterized protein n=1 Tax=Gossypium mustelinum TaxID=34275 RepID=A0A5D2WD10_GOSMU|nr:hypothetical protein E1A91_D01G239900v1 [Gossypium mustelinum]